MCVRSGRARCHAGAPAAAPQPPRLDRGALRGHIEVKPTVVDFKNIGTAAAELACDLAQHYGTVGNGDPQRDDFALAFKPSHQDGGKHAGIDIGTTLKQPNTPACKSRAG